MRTTSASYDLYSENHGSLYLVRPQTQEGREWLAANVGDDAQWLGDALAVEPRYVGDLLLGAAYAGLRVY